MTTVGRNTRLICESCDSSFALDANAVVATAELESFIAAHAYCGGVLRVSISAD